MFREEAAEWLARFQAGDYAGSASRSPNYAVMVYLRREWRDLQHAER